MQPIFIVTKRLVNEEKKYTGLILEKLLIIDKNKLYCDLKYPSLFKYLTRELGYTEAESNIRVAAVKLMQKDKRIAKKIAEGKLNLTNASEIQRTLGNQSEEVIKRAVDMAQDESTRKFKQKLQDEFNLSAPKSERVILDERMLAKMEKVKKEYGDISNYELIDVLLEEKLKAPSEILRPRSFVPKISRSIPKQVKAQVYTGVCANCGDRRNLEYDHRIPHSKNGTNSMNNIQQLCRNCNQRKGNSLRPYF